MSTLQYIRPGERFQINVWASRRPAIIAGKPWLSGDDLDAICNVINEGRSIYALTEPGNDPYAPTLDEAYHIGKAYLISE